MHFHSQNIPALDEDEDYSIILSVAPSNAPTDSLKSDISEVPAATRMSAMAAFAKYILPDTVNKKPEEGAKTVTFAGDVAPEVPPRQQLTKRDLDVHNLVNRHDDELMVRFLNHGDDPTAPDESWALPPHDRSSVKSQFGASTRSRGTQDPESSYAPVDHPSEQDSSIAGAGIWADVSVTYDTEINFP